MITGTYLIILSSNDSTFRLNIQRRSRIKHRVRKNKTAACHRGDSSSLHSVDENAAAQDAHNKNNNGKQ